MSPLENQLSKKPEVCKTYGETINQYLIKRYIEKVDTTKECHFLVHSPVVRTDKDTTKTRIVFDVSAKKDGISVNDLTHARPKLQNDLLDVLILFRRNAIAVACDISERYLQIQLNSSKSNTYNLKAYLNHTNFSVPSNSFNWNSDISKNHQNGKNSYVPWTYFS